MEILSWGVPVRAILVGTFFGYIAVVMSYVSPDTVFAFLVGSYGTLAIFVYVIISLSQLRMRRIVEREDPERLIVKMWLSPYLTYATIAGMVIIVWRSSLSSSSARRSCSAWQASASSSCSTCCGPGSDAAGKRRPRTRRSKGG